MLNWKPEQESVLSLISSLNEYSCSSVLNEMQLSDTLTEAR